MFMSDDNQLLLGFFIVYWFTLIVLLTKSENWKKTLLYNLPVHALYSGYFSYRLFYDSPDGTSLGWWFFLLVLLAIHWLINFISILRK